MKKQTGKYAAYRENTGTAGKQRKAQPDPSGASVRRWQWSALLIPVALLLLEFFGFLYLDTEGNWWPMAFALAWTSILTGFLWLLPARVSRFVFGGLWLAGIVYAVGQTGYFQLFHEMMWLSEFLYASEGSDYLDILLNYPPQWFLWIAVLLVLGVEITWNYPRWKRSWIASLAACVLILAGIYGLSSLPQRVFEKDSTIRYAVSDYGRAQSEEAAYENMFNAYRLYRICGLYHMAAKDIYTNVIYPITPAHAAAQAEGEKQIEAYFSEKKADTNEMTGIFQGKNVVLVLMESMDDWMIGEHTPTISRLMQEGITFTNFYTPPYGGIRTFNTEFCINTGSYLSSQGGYAFDYVTNHFDQSLAGQLREMGYSAKTFHYNDPSFYSRGVFSPAMGYEEYVCYDDYLGGLDEKEQEQLLYDDLLLFDNAGLREEFFRKGKPTLNFVITRSAHLSYKYNEVLSYWGLKRYPEYRGLTGNEETDCAYLKAKLVDDFFRRLMEELEIEGQLHNTVIIGVTDHYTYGYKDEKSLLALSGVQENILLEKTPCFIWSADLEPMEVTKTLNTADLLPTVLNLLGVQSAYSYVGSDAFDDGYVGFVPFSDGSWITAEAAYDAPNEKMIYLTKDTKTVTEDYVEAVNRTVQDLTRINNLILDTDYYAGRTR